MESQRLVASIQALESMLQERDDLIKSEQIEREKKEKECLASKNRNQILESQLKECDDRIKFAEKACKNKQEES